MANAFQSIFDTLKQVMPRRATSEDGAAAPPHQPATETEVRIVEQAVQTEATRWKTIVETGVPMGMLVIGSLLTVFAELIGVWGVLGFLLVAASPIVYWMQRLERRMREMTEEIRKNRPARR
jgi:hypothetical protein